MRPRMIAAAALGGALLAGGAGVAIAAIGSDGAGRPEQAVLDDAAQRLGVTSERLRDALAAARSAELDRAVRAGRPTREQADATERRRARPGHVPGPLGPPHGHRRGMRHVAPPDGHRRGMRHVAPPHGHRRGMRHAMLADLAEALGTTPAKLRERLRSGASLADVAREQGTTPAKVRAALVAKARERLDAAVAEKRMTREQADARLARIERRLRAIESGRPPRHRGGAHGARRACPDRDHRPDGAPRPGALGAGARGGPRI